MLIMLLVGIGCRPFEDSVPSIYVSELNCYSMFNEVQKPLKYLIEFKRRNPICDISE